MPYRIHWFKKNLRFQDNEILIKTDNLSSILLYIIEPELWLQKDMSQRQWDFIWESLESLKTDSMDSQFFQYPTLSYDLTKRKLAIRSLIE